MSRFSAQVDARMYESNKKHAVIFDTFNNLNIEEEMELLNDHDPKPLYYQFAAEYDGRFEWEYLEEGPEVWRVAIKRK